MVTYLFPPDTGMGAQACAQIARYLPLYGWTPVVLTAGKPDVEHRNPRAEGAICGPVIRTAVVPHPFMIYRGIKSRLGYAVDDVAGWSTRDGSGAERGRLRYWTLSLLGVPDAYAGWIPSAVVTGLWAIQRYRVEHIWSSGPPWTSHLVGLLLARLSGLPWTAHFRDPWTGPLEEMARSKPVSALSLRLETALEQMVVKRADAVVCVTEEHTMLLRHAHLQTRADKFVTIPNGFDGAEWEHLAHDRNNDGSTSKDSFVITYAGTLYNRRSPAPLFRALKALTAAGEVSRGRIRIDLLGHCEVAEGRRVTELATECGLDGHIRLTGPLGRSEALRRMMQSDLLLLLAEGLTLQIPGKAYEYLRAGRPVLALAPEGAVARLLRRTGGAWIVDPEDQAGIANAVREAYRRWREGQNLPTPDPSVVATFDRRILAGRFAELFYARSTKSESKWGAP